MHLFEAKIGTRGYHAFCNSTRQNAKPRKNVKVETEINKSSKLIDPC